MINDTRNRVPVPAASTNLNGSLEGLKVAAAIGTPRTVKVTNQSPPRRSKKGPGPSSPQEYRGPSFKDEYSFTY